MPTFQSYLIAAINFSLFKKSLARKFREMPFLLHAVIESDFWLLRFRFIIITFSTVILWSNGFVLLFIVWVWILVVGNVCLCLYWVVFLIRFRSYGTLSSVFVFTVYVRNSSLGSSKLAIKTRQFLRLCSCY